MANTVTDKGMKETEELVEETREIKDEGKSKSIGLSIHGKRNFQEVAQMLHIKFPVSWPYSSGEEVKNRFSR